MESTTTSKSRTTSRCREWERQRRLKFNDAISKLGEVVKAINKANSAAGDAEDNAQYAKIEIVQKAIICLTNCAQEKTQLKAEILALEVKLQTIEKQKLNKRDVSLQVTIGMNKKSQCSKYVKLLMLQKDKQNNTKEKVIKSTPKPKIEKKLQPAAKLPKLLPISNIKKENTFVMLPATPYIFPQRSVLFPAVQPTIVLVDANVQPINKPATIPIINRSTNDITRTTMVNVLPISAYSRPLSASKSKKNNIKSKSSSCKKIAKKSQPDETKSDDTNKIEPSTDKVIENNEATSNQNVEKEKDNRVESSKVPESVESGEEPKKANLPTSQNAAVNTEEKINKPLTEKSTDCKQLNQETESKRNLDKVVDNIEKQTICKQPVDSVKETEKRLTLQVNLPETLQKSSDPVTNLINDKCNKIVNEKNTLCDIRSKEKLQSILDPTICESVVDAGNARLELAEEFLAASPTAAFLMSFPLVSGNRADSPAEETHQSSVPNIPKQNNQQNETSNRSVPFFEKSHSPVSKTKTNVKSQTTASNSNKSNELQKYQDTKQQPVSKSNVTATPNVCNENPFLNLPMPTVVTSICTLPDTSSFSLDFDCNFSKTLATQPTTSFTNNNIFYKNDSFSAVKNTIYSTSNISSSHEFNSLGLYPCAVDSYTNKNKTDYHNTDENLMKINSSRLTYDIDLGWSHKGFDFVSCTTTSTTLHKDNILTTTPTSFSTSYNPFNPDFHVPLVTNSNRKNISSSKLNTFPETITSFYSQNSTLWPEDIPNMYSHSNVSKNFPMKQQNYLPLDNVQNSLNQKINTTKHYDQNQKQALETVPENILKTPTLLGQQIPEKFTKKSPSKMHINWMTSEVRPMQNDCTQPQVQLKDSFKLPYTQQDQSKKQTATDTNYFPINMHNFSTQPNHDETHVWPTPRPAGTTEVTIEPPPINLPTLVGDLALGPHDRKKGDLLNRGVPNSDLQIGNSFFSVTQLMNRSSDNVPTRLNGPAIEASKSTNLQKQNSNHTVSDVNRKGMPTRLENQPQLPYNIFNDTKTTNTFENMPQFSHSKSKSNKTDKNPKNQKNNYSAEALIRGGTCSQKHQDSKYIVAAQKYNDYNIAHETGVAQVSHFPPIIDYADNNFTGQQFSGTTLYNTTTNSISNTFYSNFMPSGSNLMASNYTGGHFTSDFVDYSNQTAECNYTNHKYDSKIRNNGPTYHQDKEPTTYKSTRRETAAKHKLECSKKEGNAKKYQSKRTKVSNETEEWNDPSHVLWQNKNTVKRHPNIMADEATFPNYVGNQMPTQYQPDYFNSHLVPSNTQNMGPNGERALTSFPLASSRANFNLSALFPEITTKVQ